MERPPNILGIIGIGIVLCGIFFAWMFWRGRLKAGTARSLLVLVTGIPLGIGLVYLVQFFLNRL